MKVLITRAEPSASQTAQKVIEAGHEPVVMPLFEIHDTGGQIPRKHYDAILFTSKNAVTTLSERSWKPEHTGMPAFCVGKKTEMEARALGFTNTRTTNGGGAELAKLIAKSDNQGKTFLYLSTPDKSFDMAQALHPFGITVETVDIYQARVISPPVTDFVQGLDAVRQGVVLVYSALSSRHLASLIHDHLDDGALIGAQLIGISRPAVKPLESFAWKSVSTPQTPDEAEMLAMIASG